MKIVPTEPAEASRKNAHHVQLRRTGTNSTIGWQLVCLWWCRHQFPLSASSLSDFIDRCVSLNSSQSVNSAISMRVAVARWECTCLSSTKRLRHSQCSMLLWYSRDNCWVASIPHRRRFSNNLLHFAQWDQCGRYNKSDDLSDSCMSDDDIFRFSTSIATTLLWSDPADVYTYNHHITTRPLNFCELAEIFQSLQS